MWPLLGTASSEPHPLQVDAHEQGVGSFAVSALVSRWPLAVAPTAQLGSSNRKRIGAMVTAGGRCVRSIIGAQSAAASTSTTLADLVRITKATTATVAASSAAAARKAASAPATKEFLAWSATLAPAR
jgi:hypothetical protein